MSEHTPDRRSNWASIGDPVLKEQIESHLKNAPEWEKRLDALEDNVERLLARIEGAVSAGRMLFGLVVVLASLLFSFAIWYGKERDGEISRLAAAISQLSSSVDVLKTTAEYMQREQDRQRSQWDRRIP